MLLLVPHSRDHVGDRGRAREGDRLDRQLPLDADHPTRIPDRQATSLYRGRDDRLLRPVGDRDFHLSTCRRRDRSSSFSWERLSMSIATVGFGVLISSFTRTQVAAVFATAILSIVPAVNFSGMLAPVSSLSGRGEDHRALLPLILVPAGFGRRIRQGARASPDLWKRHRRDRADRPCLPGHCRWPCFASRRREMSDPSCTRSGRISLKRSP